VLDQLLGAIGSLFILCRAALLHHLLHQDSDSSLSQDWLIDRRSVEIDLLSFAFGRRGVLSDQYWHGQEDPLGCSKSHPVDRRRDGVQEMEGHRLAAEEHRRQSHRHGVHHNSLARRMRYLSREATSNNHHSHSLLSSLLRQRPRQHRRLRSSGRSPSCSLPSTTEGPGMCQYSLVALCIAVLCDLCSEDSAEVV